MEKFNVLIQVLSASKNTQRNVVLYNNEISDGERRVPPCRLPECKHTDVTWPKSGCSYQARVQTGNLRVHVTYLRVWTRKFRLPSILERGISCNYFCQDCVYLPSYRMPLALAGTNLYCLVTRSTCVNDMPGVSAWEQNSCGLNLQAQDC